jgi:hypothetical protein
MSLDKMTAKLLALSVRIIETHLAKPADHSLLSLQELCGSFRRSFVTRFYEGPALAAVWPAAIPDLPTSSATPSELFDDKTADLSLLPASGTAKSAKTGDGSGDANHSFEPFAPSFSGTFSAPTSNEAPLSPQAASGGRPKRKAPDTPSQRRVTFALDD